MGLYVYTHLCPPSLASSAFLFLAASTSLGDSPDILPSSKSRLSESSRAGAAPVLGGGVPGGRVDAGEGGAPAASEGAAGGGAPAASEGAAGGGAPAASEGAAGGGAPAASEGAAGGGAPAASEGAAGGGAPAASEGAAGVLLPPSSSSCTCGNADCRAGGTSAGTVAGCMAGFMAGCDCCSSESFLRGSPRACSMAAFFLASSGAS